MADLRDHVIAESPSRPPSPRPRTAPHRWLAAGVFLLTVVAVPSILVTYSIRHYDRVSLLDEGVHLDYVDQILDFHVPRFGDRVGQESMRAIACRGVDWPDDLHLPACVPGAVYDPGKFPAIGYQYQAHQPPLYYVVTAPIARTITAVTGTDLLTAARFVGIGWLVGGLSVLWLVMSELGVAVFARGVICTLVGCSPSAVYLSGIVTNDAPALLTGALLALLCVRAARWRSVTRLQYLACAGLGAAAALFKPMNGLAVAVAAVFIVFARRKLGHETRKGFGSIIRDPGVVTLLGCLVGIVSWIVYYRLAAYESYGHIYDIVEGFLQVDHLHIGDVTEQVPTLFDALTNPAMGQISGAQAVAPWAIAVKFVMIGFGAGWLFHRRDLWSALGSMCLAALAIGGPIIAVVSYVQFSTAHHVPTRYGLAVFPLLAAAGAGVRKARWAWLTLGGLACLLVVGTFSFLVT